LEKLFGLELRELVGFTKIATKTTLLSPISEKGATPGSPLVSFRSSFKKVGKLLLVY
jgi:hypothetical protein